MEATRQAGNGQADQALWKQCGERLPGFLCGEPHHGHSIWNESWIERSNHCSFSDVLSAVSKVQREQDRISRILGRLRSGLRHWRQPLDAGTVAQQRATVNRQG